MKSELALVQIKMSNLCQYLCEFVSSWLHDSKQMDLLNTRNVRGKLRDVESSKPKRNGMKGIRWSSGQHSVRTLFLTLGAPQFNICICVRLHVCKSYLFCSKKEVFP